MGISLKIFLVDDDDSIERLPLTRYERLLRGEPEERLLQYAGKRVRYALVVVDLINRIPVEILRIEHSFLSFDSDGRLDLSDREKWARLALDLLPPLPTGNDILQVIDARHHFAKKRYDNEHRWAPSQKIVKAVVAVSYTHLRAHET